MGKRAAYGANWYWGIAEEAGKASRWLAAHGLPGPELLAEVLLSNEGKPYAELLPRINDASWYARSGILCPLLTGAALSDRASIIGRTKPIYLKAIAFPLLVAPYVWMSARSRNMAMELSWKDAYLVIAPNGDLLVEGEATAIEGIKAETVTCRLAGEEWMVEDWAGQRAQPVSRAVDQQAWAQLEALASRAYAPSTDVSRLSAGAGFEDND